jgi:tetratricopeptide (TPR) repeat protein
LPRRHPLAAITRTMSSTRSLASVCLYLALLASRPATAHAQEAPAAQQKAEAVKLVEQGMLHYDFGEYAQAIALFRKAYELTREPALLFNVAQAHRLAGDCHEALEAYRHFLRLSQDQALRAKAHAQSEALRPNCPAVVEGRAPAAAVETGRAPPARRSLRPWGTALAAAGVAAGAGAGALLLWNHGRYRDWSVENKQLAADHADQFQRQQANDARWRSIHKVDWITAGLAIGAAVLAAAGTTLWVAGGKRDGAITW